MSGFPGFPEGKLKVSRIPERFFADLLPLIDDLAELKVTLHCLWLFDQARGEMPRTTAAELEGDEILMRGLGSAGSSPRDALREGLERAVARGTLLQATVHRSDRPEERWFFLNSESGRAALARVERGEWTPEDGGAPVRLQTRRPTIFNLYEQNFGLIQSAMLADELKDAEATYPHEWIEGAFRIAVSNNVRRWTYVRRILENWEREGRGTQRREGDETRYADFIEH
jgi:DnaD/phage-associated family protein